MRDCKCGNVAIDGGFDYFKVSVKGRHNVISIDLPKSMTKKALYDDWNKNKDQYGYYEVGDWPDFIQDALLKDDSKLSKSS